METVVEFTLQQLIDAVLTICGLITAVAAAVGVIAVIVKKVKSPNAKQNERIANLESRVDEHDKYLKQDKEQLESIEAGNRVTQRALLALLRHGIDGNDVDGMKKAEAELQQFLIDK